MWNFTYLTSSIADKALMVEVRNTLGGHQADTVAHLAQVFQMDDGHVTAADVANAPSHVEVMKLRRVLGASSVDEVVGVMQRLFDDASAQS
jgi:hypothetical protein